MRRAARSGGAVATAVFTALRSPQPTHVGIVIRGKGARCIAWHKGITGDWLLNKVARVVYRQSDGLIVQIDCTPASATADATHYWSYWHDVQGTWKYSSAGASGYQPAAGTVEGWAYDNGGQQPPKPDNTPAGLYSAICGSADETGAPASTAPTSTAPAPTAPAPTPAPASPTPTGQRSRPTVASSSAARPRAAISSQPATSATARSSPASRRTRRPRCDRRT